jgi:hypothetical protein
MKSLDAKLAEIRATPSSRAFILADAKDADMAFGVRAPGPRGYLAQRGERPARFSPEVWTREEFGYRNLPEFLDIIREVVHQGLIDIMLMSAYVSEQLSIKEGLFRDSTVTPAARAATSANPPNPSAAPASITFNAAGSNATARATSFLARISASIPSPS